MSGCAKGGEVGEYGRVIATETRPVDPGDPYVDPPRNWKRVGLIAAAWAALWVVVGVLGWVTMQVPALAPDDRPKGSNSAPEDAVASFLNQAYGRGSIDSSQLFVCAEAAAPNAAQLRAERDQLEAANGGALSQTSTAPVVEVSGDTATVRLTVDFERIQSWNWTFDLRDDGGWQICGFTREQVPTGAPSPAPSGS